MVGLSWIELPTADAMLSLMARAERTTRATAQNEVSSRSHAILQIAVCEPAAQAWQDGVERCKLSLVDLAGSEWAAKAQSDAQVRAAVAKDWHARAHHDAPLHFPTGARRGGEGARGCHQGHQGPPRWSAFTSSLDP